MNHFFAKTAIATAITAISLSSFAATTTINDGNKHQIDASSMAEKDVIVIANGEAEINGGHNVLIQTHRVTTTEGASNKVVVNDASFGNAEFDDSVIGNAQGNVTLNNVVAENVTIQSGWGLIGQYDLESKDSNSVPGVNYSNRLPEAHFLTINNGRFENNQTGWVGVVNIYSNAEINNSIFKNNKTTEVDDGGAAITLGGHAKLTINGSTFEGNQSANIGGAIATRPVGMNAGDNAQYGGSWIEIYDSTFLNNKANGAAGEQYSYYKRDQGNGGALWLGFIGTEWKDGKLIEHKNVIDGSSFVGNVANNFGGAIHNEGRLLISGNTTFANNEAKAGKGGAIYQLGNSLELSAAAGESIVFTGNKAGDKANDIYLADATGVDNFLRSSTQGDYFTGKVAPSLILSGEGTIRMDGGIAGDANAVVTSTAANVTVNDISGLQGTLNVEGGSFTLTNGLLGGDVVVSGNATLEVTGTLTTTGENTLTVQGGTFETNISNVFAADEEGKLVTNSTVEGWAGVSGNDGALLVLNGLSSFTSDIYQQMTAQLGDFDLVVNGELTNAAELDLGTVPGYSGIHSVIAVDGDQASTEATAVLAGDTGVQALSVKEGTTQVSITGEHELLIAGNGGAVVEGADLQSMTLAGSLTLGSDVSSFGVVNADTLSAKSIDVVGQFSANKVVLGNAESTVSGTFEVDSLGQTSGASVVVEDGGKLAFNTTDVDVTLNAGSVVAIGQYQPAVADVPPVANSLALFSVETPADGQVNSLIDASAVDTLVTVGGGSEAAFQNALANAGVEYDAEKNAGIYFADTLKLDSNGKVQIGALTQAVAEGEVAVGAAGIVVIDSHRFMNTADYVIDGAARFASAAQIVLDGLNSTGDIKLSKTWNSTGTNVTFVDGNAFFNETLTANVDSDPSAVINVATNEAAFAGDAETYKLVDSMLAPTADEGIRNVVTAIGREDGAFINEGKLTDDGFRALDETFAMPVTAGTYNVAYDAAEQVTGTVQRRNLEPSTGLGVWADVFYSTNEAKSIYGGQGYSADIYGGTIGFDGTFSCGAKLGLALSVGSGDADSEKSVGKYSNDADFYGVTVYTGKDIAGLYFSADASYLWLDNDISGQVAGASVNESIDSNVFTVGVRADMTVYDQAFKVVPHVGMRYTNIDVDNYRGIESDSMNVFEMPIGVKVAGDFEPAAGWKLTPSFDFTVVPQVGDKNVSTLVGDIDVLDNLYNSTLGVNATYGNFAFGLSYRYGFGNDDRSNNAFQARASYQF